MYLAHIDGWESVEAFSEDKEKAKKLAIKKKKEVKDLERFPMDGKWTWEKCEEHYGAWVIEIKDGMTLHNLREE